MFPFHLQVIWLGLPCAPDSIHRCRAYMIYLYIDINQTCVHTIKYVLWSGNQTTRNRLLHHSCFFFSFLFIHRQKGGLTAKQRAGHRGGVPDGFYKDGSLVWNVILWTVHHRCQLWLKHLVGSHVHIGDSTTEPERRPRHGEPARCYGGPPGLPGAGHRANPWNRRGLASSLITSYLPCHSTVIAASSLPRISKVEAHIVYNRCIKRNIFQIIFNTFR